MTSARFEAAVKWVDSNISSMALAGFLGPGQPPWVVTASELRVRLAIDFWHFGNDNLPSPVTENQAALLWSMAEKERGAFDMARHLAATYIHHGWNLPEGLKIFSTLFLAGQMKEPMIEKGDRNFFRNFVIIFYSTFAASGFGLLRTRGDYSDPISGCDAVVNALAKNGIHIGYRAAKDLIVGNKPSQRANHQKLQEIFSEFESFSKRNQLLLYGPDGVSNLPRSTFMPLGGTSK